MSILNVLQFSILIILGFLSGENRSATAGNNTSCEDYEKCNECLQRIDCVWCLEPVFLDLHVDTKSHCILKHSFGETLCPKNLLVDPPTNETIIANRPLQSVQEDHVQIAPQKLKLTLRVGQEHQVHFQYAQAKNYPIDLYYIMDYSASMEEHRKKLAKLGNKIAETMTRITSNFRIGFGSFVDKVEMPFVSTVKEKLASPCTLNKNGYKIKCEPAYGFRNHMSLSNNHTKFSMEVSQAQVSGNLDTPEGGFDAIMQAIVCKNEIGWRDQARHLLVFSTDAVFHIAGDGKLAGVLEPNDGKCHMTNNFYNGSLLYDYPSISQLNDVAKINNINIIFAIVKGKKDVLDSYETLSENIENSNVGGLDENSDNVIDLILDNYKKIVDSVVIGTNSNENISVKIIANCTEKIGRGCSGIHVGETVNFTATIKPLSCVGQYKDTLNVTLKPEAVDENLYIDLNVICGCDCEMDGHPHNLRNHSNCSSFGDLTCGACSCYPGRQGSRCECAGAESNNVDQTNCIPPGSTLPCSGLGSCNCGKCDCFTIPNGNQKFSGKYCHCDNFSCNREQGLLCGGRGRCSCGTCICNAGWSGSACECLDDDKFCIREGHATEGVCSGRGTCKCGKCECSEAQYTGKYCEDCPTCRDRCKELKNCVQCKVFHTKNSNGTDCDLECSEYTIETVENINDEYLGETAKQCRFSDENTCTVSYKYFYSQKGSLIVKVQREKSCPPNALVWTLCVIASIVITGLITLLLWKIFTTIHDRREYAKFETERNKSKWHGAQNPLYRPSTTTFLNPFYKT